MKIAFTGGNTRGEVFSIVALIDEIRTIYSSVEAQPGLRKRRLEIFYVGCLQKFNKEVFGDKKITIKDIYINEEGETIMGHIVDILFKIPFGLPITFFQSLFRLIKIRPDLVFSKGGYDSVPIVAAAWLLRIPIFIHESNAIPTRGSYLVRKLALKIFTSYPKTGNLFFGSRSERLNLEYLIKKKIVFTGVPIRRKIIEVSQSKISKIELKKFFDLESQRPVLLFLNESSPAIEDEKINDIVLHILPELLSKFEVIHQSGHKCYPNIKKEAAVFLPKETKKYYRLYPFLDEKALGYAYLLSDLIITRGGAGTIFEMALFGKPSVIVPLFHFKSRYQITNAYFYSYGKDEACLVVEETNFLPYFLQGTIKNLFIDKEAMDKMAENAKQFAQPQATKIVAEEIINFLFSKRKL